MAPEVAYLTASEIAARYRVDASTVRRWAAKGQLKPAITTPGGHKRFDPADVARLLNVAVEPQPA